MDYVYSIADPDIDSVYVLLAVLIALLTGMISYFCYRKGILSAAQMAALVMLIPFVFLVFASTIFSRTPTADYKYRLVPFWSYQRILQGSKFLFWEDVLNVFMLMPVGILLPVVISRYVKRGCGKKVILTGFVISAVIELSQLLLKRGLFEFDDMIHNTVGVAIGYGIYFKLKKHWR